LLASPQVAFAQGPTVNNPPNTQEYGVDAGAMFGLGDRSNVNFSLPTSRARIGFFLNNDSRWSVEPSVGLSYNKVEDVPYQLNYNLELGALYHFSPPRNLYDATRASVAYLRPFVGIVGLKTGGDDGGSDSEATMGVGYGIKIPFRNALAWRLEANVGYGLDNEAFRVGAMAGVSFFARDLIPTGGR
jgi:hypothetical protein